MIAIHALQLILLLVNQIHVAFGLQQKIIKKVIEQQARATKFISCLDEASKYIQLLDANGIYVDFCLFDSFVLFSFLWQKDNSSNNKRKDNNRRRRSKRRRKKEDE